MPLEWQAKMVALLEEAEEMGVITPGFSVSMKDEHTNRFRKIPHEWLNYRRGTLREAMALMEREEAEHEQRNEP